MYSAAETEAEAENGAGVTLEHGARDFVVNVLELDPELVVSFSFAPPVTDDSVADAEADEVVVTAT